MGRTLREIFWSNSAQKPHRLKTCSTSLSAVARLRAFRATGARFHWRIWIWPPHLSRTSGTLLPSGRGDAAEKPWLAFAAMVQRPVYK